MLAPAASMRDRIAMYNGNALKIGLFGANCSSGTLLKVPERWSASWEEYMALLQARRRGWARNTMLPVARWKGITARPTFRHHARDHYLVPRTARRELHGHFCAPARCALDFPRRWKVAAKEFVTAFSIVFMAPWA